MVEVWNPRPTNQDSHYVMNLYKLIVFHMEVDRIRKNINLVIDSE